MASSISVRSGARPSSRLALWALVAVVVQAVACRSGREQADPGAAPAPAPDRLREDEELPEAETAFGLPVPAGMRLSRHFRDAAYFSGQVPMSTLIEHVRSFVHSQEVEMMSRRVVFARARIKGDERQRLVRIEISEMPRGSQIYIRDITPEPATQVATEAERWRRAGRNPDGTPIDQNRLY